MALPTTANVTQPRARGYEALLTYGAGAADNLYLRLTGLSQPTTVETAQLDGPRINTSQLPEEIRDQSGQVFARSDFSGGEGLSVAHRRNGEDSDTQRYWDSVGIDVVNARPGQPAKLQLLHNIALSDGTANTNLFLKRVEDLLIYASGSNVRVSDDAGATWSTEAVGGTVLGKMAVSGQEIYAPISGAIRKRTYAGTWADWSTQVAVPDQCWAVKGRLLVSEATALYEVGPDSPGGASFDETGGAFEDLWTVTDHGLVYGDVIEFTEAGTGATGYAIDTPYKVMHVPTSDTFRLRSWTSGPPYPPNADTPVEGTGDGSGWLFSVGGIPGVSQTSTGVTLLLANLPDGTEWTDVTDAGSAILATASDGNVYAFVSNDGTLELVAQSRFEGEQPIEIEAVQGFVFLTTRVLTTSGGYIGRLWRAVLATDYRLVDAQVIRTWGDDSASLDFTPVGLETTRSSLFMAVLDDATDLYLWRYDLESAGFHRHILISDANIDVCQGIAMLNNRLFVSIKGDGVWKEAETYVTSGYLIGPLADFYTASDKHWVGARVDQGDLNGVVNSAVELEYATEIAAITDAESALWTTVYDFDYTADYIQPEQDISDTRSRYIAGMVTLTRGDTTTSTPTVYGFSFRALATTDDIVFEIPVNISDQTEAPRRRRKRIKGRGDAVYQKLKSYEAKPVTVQLFYPDDTIRGQLESVSREVLYPTPQGSPTLVALLRVRGTRV